MELTTKQKQYLKGLAHKLNPAVQTGKSSVTPKFVKEVDRNLEDHELIKVKIVAEERGEFTEIAEQLAKDTSSEVVQVIGRIAVFYRPSKKNPEIKLPRVSRPCPV